MAERVLNVMYTPVNLEPLLLKAKNVNDLIEPRIIVSERLLVRSRNNGLDRAEHKPEGPPPC